MLDLIGQPKMIIHAYSDPTFRDKVDEFVALLNPERYTLDYAIQFQENQAPGTSGSELTFEMIRPQHLEFEFLFDRTGAVGGLQTPSEDGVHTDVNDFKNLTIGFDGTTHRTKYLILAWGKLLFKCCCTHLNITYKLFRPDGVPLRAVAKAKFEEFRESGQRVREENKNSPDLTHIRMVKQGDTLPLMTHAIYGDAKYYLEVARVNGLTNFRKLQVGQKIFFPPLEK